MSKPQIITMDGGHHNSDLEVARSRTLQGATWKKQRVIVLIPSSDLIPAKVALSHASLIFPPNQGVHRMLCLGMEVGDAYSTAIENILAHPELSQWEFILTIEADNIPPSDGVLTLIQDMEEHPELHCIGGLYWCKGPGGCAHIWGDRSDPVVNFRPQAPVIDGIQECYGNSMGFHLWRLSIFKDERLPKPLFNTKASKNGVGTQDLAFWGEAIKYGYRAAVDTRIKVGHYDYAGAFGVADFSW